jgi:hypothetical protein
LVYFPSFGMLFQEKSGNPDLNAILNSHLHCGQVSSHPRLWYEDEAESIHGGFFFSEPKKAEMNSFEGFVARGIRISRFREHVNRKDFERLLFLEPILRSRVATPAL